MYDPVIGRWGVVDPHAGNYFNASPYSYVENNPLIRIDPDGKDWLNSNDEKKAKELQEQAQNRIDQLNKNNEKVQEKLVAAQEKGKENKVDRLQGRIDNNKSMVAELNRGISEISKLGSTADYTFTFTSVNSEDHNVKLLGNTEKGKPLISLEYSSNAIAIHEARHAFQYITTGQQTGTMRFSLENGNRLISTSRASAGKYETSAYRLQYSFSPSSLPIPAPNTIGGINPNWIKKFPNNPYRF